jgi:hypothetical protein
MYLGNVFLSLKMSKKKLLVFSSGVLLMVFFVMEFFAFKILKVVNPSDFFLDKDILFGVSDRHVRIRKNVF